MLNEVILGLGFDMDTPVICSNTDDPEGANGNARLSYIGQDLEQAGYFLAEELTKILPQGEKHHFLVSVGGPGLLFGQNKGQRELLLTWKKLAILMKD